MSPTTLAGFGQVLKRDLGVLACLYKPRLALDRLVKAVGEQVRA
jgi:hypothetical protein